MRVSSSTTRSSRGTPIFRPLIFSDIRAVRSQLLDLKVDWKGIKKPQKNRAALLANLMKEERSKKEELDKKKDGFAANGKPTFWQKIFRTGPARRKPIKPVLAPKIKEERIWNEFYDENAPLLTVVIPCFNYGHFLSEAVTSILQQTWTDYELVLVDGGSTDGKTPAVIVEQSQRDPRIRYVLREKRTTIGEDRLNAIQDARGKYVVFMDADDLLDPTYFEKAISTLEIEGMDVVTPWVKAFSQRLGADFLNNSDLRDWRPAGLVLPEILHGNYCSTTAVFRRSFWTDKNIGYFTEKAHYEDWDFWIRWATQGARSKPLKEMLHYYRVHGGSLTDDANQNHSSHATNVQKRFWKYIETPTLLIPALKRQGTLVRMERSCINLRRRFWSKYGGRPQPRVLFAVPFYDRRDRSFFLREILSPLKSKLAMAFVATDPSQSYFQTQGVDLFQSLTESVFSIGHLRKDWRRTCLREMLIETKPNVLVICDSVFAYSRIRDLKKANPALRVLSYLDGGIRQMVRADRFLLDVDGYLVADAKIAEELKAKLPASRHDRIYVVSRGIDVGTFVAPTTTEEMQVLKGQAISLGFYSSFSETKGAFEFISAVRRTPHSTGLLCGMGPFRKDAVVHALPEVTEGKIDFCSPEDPSEFFEQIDLLIVPQVSGRIPLAMMRAMSRGIPCLAADCGAVPEVLSDGQNGFLYNAGNVKELTKKIADYLAMDPQKRADMAAAARKTAQERFSAEGSANEFELAINKVLEEARNLEEIKATSSSATLAKTAPKAADKSSARVM